MDTLNSRKSFTKNTFLVANKIESFNLIQSLMHLRKTFTRNTALVANKIKIQLIKEKVLQRI